jgi:hypothetical protein
MEHNLFLKPEKCAFEQPSIEFLGVRITQGKVQMYDTKVEKVRNWKPPTNVTEVCKFLGFTGYYRYFIKDYSKIARPLLQLTHLTTTWHWDEDKQTVTGLEATCWVGAHVSSCNRARVYLLVLVGVWSSPCLIIYDMCFAFITITP